MEKIVPSAKADGNILPKKQFLKSDSNSFQEKTNVFFPLKTVFSPNLCFKINGLCLKNEAVVHFLKSFIYHLHKELNKT